MTFFSRLRALAQAATPWWMCEWDREWDRTEKPHSVLDDQHMRDMGINENLRPYIAFLSPDRALLLAEALEAAQVAAKTLDAEIEQHEAFFLQAGMRADGWGTDVQKFGIAQAKRDLAALRAALAALDRDELVEGAQ